MEPPEDGPGRRINPFEIALWVFGVVAVTSAIWGAEWANGTQSLANGGYYCDAAGNCTERYDYVQVHTVLTLAPSVMTAGLIAIVVVLALRAWPAVRSAHGRVGI